MFNTPQYILSMSYIEFFNADTTHHNYNSINNKKFYMCKIKTIFFLLI